MEKSDFLYVVLCHVVAFVRSMHCKRYIISRASLDLSCQKMITVLIQIQDLFRIHDLKMKQDFGIKTISKSRVHSTYSPL